MHDKGGLNSNPPKPIIVLFKSSKIIYFLVELLTVKSYLITD